MRILNQYTPLSFKRGGFQTGIHPSKAPFAAFRGNCIQEDTFNPEIIEAKFEDYGKVEGRIYKTFTLKDLNQNPVPGFILQDKYSKSSFYACVKNGDEFEGLVRMSFYEETDRGDDGHLYLSALFGSPKNKEYQGAGSELLKVAVKESTKRGFDGRVELTMTGSFPFYYKNNCRIDGNSIDDKKAGAFLDYTTRHSLNPALYWQKGWTQDMKLDEDGAKALIEGKRYFDSSKSETLHRFSHTYITSEGKTAKTDGVIDFSDLSDGKTPKEFALQYLKGGAFDLRQTAFMTGVLGDDSIQINYYDCTPPRDDINEMSKTSIKKEFIRILKRKFPKTPVIFTETKEET